MAATMISQFVEQTNTEPAHYEHFIYDAQPIADGEAANAIVETHRKSRKQSQPSSARLLIIAPRAKSGNQT